MEEAGYELAVEAHVRRELEEHHMALKKHLKRKVLGSVLWSMAVEHKLKK